MASVRPQKLIHPDVPIFETGAAADLTVIEKQDNQLKIIRTIKRGKEVYVA
jgi:hypothetical protein